MNRHITHDGSTLPDPCTASATGAPRLRRLLLLGACGVLGFAATTCGQGGYTPKMDARGEAGQNRDDPPADDPGWTVFEPSNDTRVVYVSSSLGNDANSGFSASKPKQTIAAGRDLLRDGYPDWLLLKCGDVFEDEWLGTWKISGRSDSERMLISSYGDGDARPLLRTGESHGFQTKISTPVRHLAIVGLHFNAHTYDGDASPVGIRWLSSGEDFLVEDCMIEGYSTNVVIQNAGGGSLEDFRLRRSVIVDSYAVGSHSQGIFCKLVDGVLIEECVFDHNGWNENVPGADPTDFNHNIYIQTDCTDLVIRDNIICNGSSAGAQARPGGIVEGNLFVSNPVSLRFGGGDDPVEGGVSGEVIGNVILRGDDIRSDLPRGHGITLQNVIAASVTDNIIAFDESAQPYGQAFLFGANRPGEVGVHNVLLANNTVYKWRGGIKIIGAPGSQLTDIAITQNVLQDPGDEKPLIRHFESEDPDEFSYEGNVYFANGSSNRWFEIDGLLIGFSQWVPTVEEEDGEAREVEFADSDRSLATYNSSIGGDASFHAFMAEARLQAKSNWREEYTTAVVVEYFREGFAPAGSGHSGSANLP